MIFLLNAAGEITAEIPTGINQGSIGVNDIIVIAPFPSSSVVSAAFKLPNGIRIVPKYVPLYSPPDTVSEGEGETVEEYPYVFALSDAFVGKLEGYNVWRLLLDKAITQFYGNVEISFLISSPFGTLATGATQVPINRTTSYINPSVTESDLTTISEYLSAALDASNAASDSADAAATSAGNAATSEVNAATSAGEASDSADAAATSATNAHTDAERAKGYADTLGTLLDNVEDELSEIHNGGFE